MDNSKPKIGDLFKSILANPDSASVPFTDFNHDHTAPTPLMPKGVNATYTCIACLGRSTLCPDCEKRFVSPNVPRSAALSNLGSRIAEEARIASHTERACVLILDRAMKAYDKVVPTADIICSTRLEPAPNGSFTVTGTITAHFPDVSQEEIERMAENDFVKRLTQELLDRTAPLFNTHRGAVEAKERTGCAECPDAPDEDHKAPKPATSWHHVNPGSLQKAPPDAFPKVLYERGMPELWLVYRDVNGMVTPVPGTEPLEMPEQWQIALIAAKSFHR